jgi:hypothetical protein
MNQPRNHLLRDLQAVRYLEALAAGDLEVVAALWEKASADPELERTLSEIDGTLFGEEDRLHRRGQSRRRRRWVGVAVALAAACLLVVLLLRWRGGRDSVPSPSVFPAPPEVVHGPPVTFDRVAATRIARRELDEAELPSFTWPLSPTSPVRPTSLPADQIE